MKISDFFIVPWFPINVTIILPLSIWLFRGNKEKCGPVFFRYEDYIPPLVYAIQGLILINLSINCLLAGIISFAVDFIFTFLLYKKYGKRSIITMAVSHAILYFVCLFIVRNLDTIMALFGGAITIGFFVLILVGAVQDTEGKGGTAGFSHEDSYSSSPPTYLYSLKTDERIWIREKWYYEDENGNSHRCYFTKADDGTWHNLDRDNDDSNGNLFYTK